SWFCWAGVFHVKHPRPFLCPEVDVSRETSTSGNSGWGSASRSTYDQWGHVSSCVGNVGAKKSPSCARPDPPVLRVRPEGNRSRKRLWTSSDRWWPMASAADVPPESDVSPEQAEEVFGGALPRVRRYADLLAGEGVKRGLIGPREVPRLWGRHLVNCAVVEELLPEGAEVVDVGSGAGLPGLVLGRMRPDIHMTLLEPLLRRTVFLKEAVGCLELPNVEVIRGRAEEKHGDMYTDFITARAVAPLDRLARWSLPLLRKNGSMWALKGEQAEAELADAEKELSKLRPSVSDVIKVGRGKVEP